MIQVNVQCGCTRTMRPDGSGGGRYRCGCGARVTLSGLPRFDATHCPMPRANRVCNGPKRPDDLTCQPCAVMIAKFALKDPEVVEQIGESAGLSAYYQARDAEAERRRERDREAIVEVRQRDDARKVCVVYYCELRPGVIKIGTTTNLAERMDAFRVPACNVLAAEPGHYKLENLRHKQFTDLRIDPAREDFHHGEALQAHIEKVVGIHGQPFDLVARIHDMQQRELASRATQS